MTRFARADGSKGSNKRTLEEATPWSEMVRQRKVKPIAGSNLKSNKEKTSTKAKTIECSDIKKKDIKGKKRKQTEGDPVNINENNNDPSSSILDSDDTTEPHTSKKVKGTKEGIENEEDELNQTPELKMKKKKKKKGEPIEEKVEFKLNDEGKRVKVFKDGKERPYFDLPYEESDTMTRFDGFWVEKEAIANLFQLQQSLQDENHPETVIKKKMMKAKRKAHKELRIKLVLEQKDILKSINGTEIKTDKKEKKVKKQTTKEKPENKKKLFKDKTYNKEKSFKQEPFIRKVHYEETDYMTCYDGYWVRKAAVIKLEAMKIIRHKEIIHKRPEGSAASDLTKEEQVQYQRLLKKERRNEASKLKSDISKNTLYLENPEEYEGFESYLSNGLDTSDMIRYEGVWIKKEGAERLQILKEKLTSEGLSTEEVLEVMKKERRKEERSFKTEKRMKCFNCRQTGHQMSQCPSVGSGANAMPVVGVCFKCGSTEHKAFDCNVKGKTDFPYAECFICGEAGHISRSCPDNPRGMYPDGGCCKVCGSVEHLAKDCPDQQEENQQEVLKVGTINTDALEALDEPTPQQQQQPIYDCFASKRTNKKIVF